ncbi:protein kinase domain-containing protein [Polyangium aurulentum]|uniref:protein kinase domain-containing protein n=1 Tax=Polyangium aurulentum TaxID=2567896 RepID=UPI00146D6982|nr:protein kinase [Polyangium aurulentum]UQA59996.1 protein kinase [Polyangium aurulentum]
MDIGAVLEGRFELEAIAGSGGMGTVFRARDRQTGGLVAVKIIAGDAGDVARFAREARLLSELSHPGIVGHVADGIAEDGHPYLAMEWLEGQDLSKRLARGGLTVRESVTLAMRVAEALGAAHARGIVHRDLKPSNVFLVDGDVARPKLLDFGIAYLGAGTRVTQSGLLLGTPAYMAPEQARGARELDARADVFALGSVLFECLTGTPAFQSNHLMAVLAKILFEDSPQLRAARPDLPAGLDELVARMLAKEPEERPRDGFAVAEALAAIDLSAQGAPLSAAIRAAALTSDERRAMSLVVFVPKHGEKAEATASSSGAEAMVAERRLRRVVAEFGGQLELLVDGTAVVALAGAGVATDGAVAAARCALALRPHAADGPIVLVTGRAETTARLPVGAAVDRAARMLARREHERDAPSPITLDEVTAGLLDSRFDVRPSGAGFVLHGERELFKEMRTLLGKPTPCVGRDRELMGLEQMCMQSMEEPVALAALVTAPAGAGKSRLAFELIGRLRAHGEPVSIWVGRGDLLRAGSPFGMLGGAIRGAFGIQEGEPLESRRAKLQEGVAARIGEADRRRVADFLGEIIGAPMPDDDNLPLRAARCDAKLMGEQMRAAWIDFLLGETAARPLVLVLEDLHWGDLATVRAIDAALGAMQHRPLAVLALARPEVHDVFPKLWAGRSLQEIRLRALPAKASERLVQTVLGEDASPTLIERIVKLADGNAFYLEELIRAAHERRGEALPETVVAMVESRLARLDERLRRLLRAASIFGEVFWDGGLARLLGDTEGRAHSAAEGLGELVTREIIVRRPVTRFPGEREYAFRHALLREGAYAMLTEADRKLGHRLAGEWLEGIAGASAERDGVIGDHFVRGEAWEKAAESLHRAGDAALGVQAHLEARAHYERALACLSHLPDTEERRRRRVRMVLNYQEASWLNEAPERSLERLTEAERVASTFEDREGRATLVRVRAALGRLHAVRCDFAKALDASQGAMEDAIALNEQHLVAVLRLTISQIHGMQGHYGVEALDEVTTALETLEQHPDDWASWFMAVSHRAMVLGALGRYEELLRTIARLLPRATELRSMAALTMAHSDRLYALFMAWDMPAIAEAARATIEAAERSGDSILVWLGAWMSAWAKAHLGDHDAAANDAARAHALLAQFGGWVFMADWFLATDAGRVLLAGRPAEAAALAEKAVEWARAHALLYGRALAERFWGEALAALDPPQWDEAEAHLAESARIFEACGMPMELARTERAWGLVCRGRGDQEGARIHLARALALFEGSDLAFELERTRKLVG